MRSYPHIFAGSVRSFRFLWQFPSLNTTFSKPTTKNSAFYTSVFVVWAVFQPWWRKKTYLKRRPLFSSQIFNFCCDIQGSHLIGCLWVSLIIDQSECLICYFLCTELPENCIYLNQSELSNFFHVYYCDVNKTAKVRTLSQPTTTRVRTFVVNHFYCREVFL